MDGLYLPEEWTREIRCWKGVNHIFKEGIPIAVEIDDIGVRYSEADTIHLNYLLYAKKMKLMKFS